MSKQYSEKILSWVLPFLTGEKPVTENIINEAKKDSEKLAVLTTCSLIYRNRDTISVKNTSINIFEKKSNFYFTDFGPTKEKFISLDIEEDLSCLGLDGYTFMSMAGDDFGVIFDSDDKEVLFCKYFTDSRCPWLTFPGDTRKVQFQLTYFSEPDSNGFVKRINGWKQQERGPYVYDGTGLTVSAFDRVPSHIMSKYIAPEMVVEEEALNRLTMTMKDRRLFIMATNLTSQDENHVYEISKEATSPEGIIHIDGNEVGKISLVRSSALEYRAMVDITGMLPDGVGKNHAINMWQIAAIPQTA